MIVLHIMVAVVGILFITDFKFRKPTTIEIFLIVIAIAAAVLALIFVERSWWKFIYIPRR